MDNLLTKIKSVLMIPLRVVSKGSMKNKLRFWIVMTYVTFLSIAAYFLLNGWPWVAITFILASIGITIEIYKIDHYENPKDYHTHT